MPKITIPARRHGKSAARIAELETMLRKAEATLFKAAILLSHAEVGGLGDRHQDRIRLTKEQCIELCGSILCLTGDNTPLGGDANQ